MIYQKHFDLQDAIRAKLDFAVKYNLQAHTICIEASGFSEQQVLDELENMGYPEYRVLYGEANGMVIWVKLK